jgi:glucose/arabinose dehydrogenase
LLSLCAACLGSTGCTSTPPVVPQEPGDGATEDTSTADAATGDSTAGDATTGDGTTADAANDSPFTWIPVGDASIAHPCTLPGSIQYAGGARSVVGTLPASWPDLSFLQLPDGFCVHYYATVPNARQLRFAPGGELFVASPTTPTTGGGRNTTAAIVVIPDDNGDGLGDAQVTFLSGPTIASTQGLMFANGNFYYQSGTQIFSMPYASGTRVAAGPGTVFADVTLYTSSLHWPKALDIADDGTIYVGNGGDQGETCEQPMPFHGGILALDGTPGGRPIAQGFRNPIAIRCWHGHGSCFALELAKDYSTAEGGREKMVPIRSGDDWGFPCCATQNLPYAGITPTPDCSGVAGDSDSFLIGDTPFGLDFEPGLWPAPWTNAAIVATHGAAGSWAGARVVAIGMDPTTGLALPATDAEGGNAGAMTDFATGWDDQTTSHGRPAAVTFASDGRLFLANDSNGIIVWIAPNSM